MSTVTLQPKFLAAMRRNLRSMQSFWSEIYDERLDLLCLPNGNADGPQEVWYGNTLSELKHWRDGVPHGTSEKWYYSGEPFERGYHINGKRHGPFEVWHANGQLDEITIFDQDEIVKSQYWDENGESD